jgi:hypothetical protein
MKDLFSLGLTIIWDHQSLISAFKDDCPLRSVTTGRRSLKWKSELESLRIGVGGFFNKFQAEKNQ